MRKDRRRKVITGVKRAVKVLQDANRLGRKVRPARLISKGLGLAAGMAQNDVRKKRLQNASDLFAGASNISGYGRKLINPAKKAARQQARTVRRAARIAGRPARIAKAKEFGKGVLQGIRTAHQLGQKYKPISTAANIAGVLAPPVSLIPGIGGALGSALELGSHGGKLLGDVTGYGVRDRDRKIRKQAGIDRQPYEHRKDRRGVGGDRTTVFEWPPGSGNIHPIADEDKAIVRRDRSKIVGFGRGDMQTYHYSFSRKAAPGTYRPTVAKF